MTPQLERPDSKTIVIGDKRYSFEQRIKDVVTSESLIVIRLVSSDFRDGDAEAGRNILAFGQNGSFRWRIEDSGFTVRTSDGVEMPQGYTGLRMTGGELIAFQPIGCDCTIDVETGRILSSKQSK